AGGRPYVEVEPVVLARLFGENRETRILINLEDVPDHLTKAVVAIEDRRFFEHRGIDGWGIARALWADLMAGRIVQGGSTITQQLVKNYFLEPERTLKRKLLEAAMAVVLEARYSKEDILEMYLNEIYLGQWRSMAIHGIGEAARFYFGRNVEDLSLGESAVLAGMIQAPNRYSPYKNPDLCRERRNVVLQRMRDLQFITAQAYEKALSEPIRTAPRPMAGTMAPYYVDLVRAQLEALYSKETLASEGLVIYTAYHPEIAWEAEKAVKEGLAELEARNPRLRAEEPTEVLQAALVVVHPKTGALTALVGGRDYALSTFNRALQAHRQPGSAFKPFVYLSALDRLTPLSRIDDVPKVYKADGSVWTPRNYDGHYRGTVTVREALTYSLNAATVNMAAQIGFESVVETARRLGFRSRLDPFPSLALGAFEVTPLEMAGAYAALANEGQRPELMTIRKVVTPKGTVLEQRHMEMTTVTTPAKAFLITHMLQNVVEEGTARGLSSLGITFPCAGKTGTTSDYRDSWFVGYTSDLLALVWVGFDDNRSTGLSGATGALRLWARFMKNIRPWIAPQPFAVPPGVVERRVCAESGEPATPGCPRTETAYFLEDLVPTTVCPLHGN
ncbi:transglycosylase domain-containing protein, partial [Desulfosoma sp.]